MLYIPHVAPERVAVGPDSGKRVTVEHAHNDMKMMDRLLRSKRLLRFLPSHLFGMYWYALRASEAFVLLVLKSLAHTKMSLCFILPWPSVSVYRGHRPRGIICLDHRVAHVCRRGLILWGLVARDQMKDPLMLSTIVRVNNCRILLFLWCFCRGLGPLTGVVSCVCDLLSPFARQGKERVVLLMRGGFGFTLLVVADW